MMTLFRVAKQGLRFYWRTHGAVVLAVAVATAVLTGALAVGDSMRYTLKLAQEARLGHSAYALVGGDRFFRAAWAEDLADRLDTEVAPVLVVPGMLAAQGQRLNQVQVYGADERFYQVWQPDANRPSDGILLNGPVAQRLGVAVGDTVVLRWEKPSLMPRGAVLTPTRERTTAARLTVRGILTSTNGGAFGLQASQVIPLNVFVPLSWLQQQLGRENQANLMLMGPTATSSPDAVLQQTWQPADAGLTVKKLSAGDWQLESQRVFIDDALVRAAQTSEPEAQSILTYFVNTLRHDDHTTPYSMVAALQPGSMLLPTDLADDEIVVNQWLADDLQATPGDTLTLSYWIMGTDRKLQEASRTFRVHSVVPMVGAAIDPNLMPNFTGLSGSEHCRDWEPGIPLDLSKIRDKDEAYWDTYRGTPKAFVSLAAGQAMWANPYGRVTALRYPASADSQTVLTRLMHQMSPASLGLFCRPVQALGNAARAGGTDFGGLFLGLSMFLIGAALILIGLLFVFGIENRHEQIGILAALGWTRRRIKSVFLLEGLMVALLGATVGTWAGLIYTRVMVWGLQHLWQGATHSTTVMYHAGVSSIVTGWFSGGLTSVIAMAVVLRKQVKRSARALLTGTVDPVVVKRRHKVWQPLLIALSLVGAVALMATAQGKGSEAISGAFFGAGTLLLTAMLLGAGAWLKAGARKPAEPVHSLVTLGWRNARRRPGRSVAVIGLLAFGLFVVVAVGANRQNPMAHARERSSGTGGFALYGESTLGILEDLNSQTDQQKLGLDTAILTGVHFVQMRVHAGDDASCLNLNRAQQPRLLGVDPTKLNDLQAFAFNQSQDNETGLQGWNLLHLDLGPHTVPVIGDYPTVVWALGKHLGDTLTITDQKGDALTLQIVGLLADSILQGSLLMSDDAFARAFPADVGTKAFLIDCSQEKTSSVVQTLSDRLVDDGLLLTPAVERLAAFHAVENTYLSIFTALGGLGLVLGTLGLGLVVLRNVLERRPELALLRAVGFETDRLVRLTAAEHVALLVIGLLGGVVCALVAVVPALQSAANQIPIPGLVLTVSAIGLCGVACVWWAARLALHGTILDALRNE